MTTTIFQQKIITMDPSRPEATHVAVKEGRILGVGGLAELKAWGAYSLDERFADKVLMPGFVEGHAHAMEGSFWRKTYCGYFGRMDPEEKICSGLTTIDAVLARLSEAEQQLDDAEAPLSGWQLDPIYMGNQRLSRGDLDRVSTTRPIEVLHAPGHILNVNTKALSLSGLLKSGINHPGIPLDHEGLPTGELKGPEVMMSVAGYVGFDRSLTDADAQGLQDFAKICVRAGVTTVTDLASRLSDETVEMMQIVTSAEDFSARLVPLKVFIGLSPKDLIARVGELAKLSTDRLRLGKIKIVADGSIQGFPARMRWSGYYNGAPNGLWYITPEQLSEIYHLALEAGVQVHTHINGDQAI